MTDTVSPFQWSPIVVKKQQNIDLGHITNSRMIPPSAISDSLPVPTTRGDTNKDRISILRSAGADFATSLLNAAKNQSPSMQARRGDQKLARARDSAIKYESVIAVNDRRTIEDKIAQ